MRTVKKDAKVVTITGVCYNTETKQEEPFTLNYVEGFGKLELEAGKVILSHQESGSEEMTFELTPEQFFRYATSKKK